MRSLAIETLMTSQTANTNEPAWSNYSYANGKRASTFNVRQRQEKTQSDCFALSLKAGGNLDVFFD